MGSTVSSDMVKVKISLRVYLDYASIEVLISTTMSTTQELIAQAQAADPQKAEKIYKDILQGLD